MKNQNIHFLHGLNDVYLWLAADILFYSFSEWVLYATDPHIEEMGTVQDWAGVYPLFHWSFIPWGFYLVLAVAFGFMLHVRKEIDRNILKHVDQFSVNIRMDGRKDY